MRRKHPVLTFVGIIFLVLCAISWVFGSILHEHEWLDATCTEPRTCKTCGEIDGEPLGHDWKKATCTEPKTCLTCHTTEGTATGHVPIAATCTESEICSVCDKTLSPPLGHTWVNATYVSPKTCSTCGAQEGEPVKVVYDKIQQFFIDLPTDITRSELEKLVKQNSLFYSPNKGIYTISDKENPYSAYTGQQANSKLVSQSCIIVVFNSSADTLSYALYLNYYGPYNGHGEALYYNCGRFGDISKILWDEYIEEDIGKKYYYYVGGIQYSDDETILNVTFRNDEDVPYYYRGKTIQTGFRICDSAEEAVNYTLSLPNQID